MVCRDAEGKLFEALINLCIGLMPSCYTEQHQRQHKMEQYPIATSIMEQLSSATHGMS